MIYIDGSHLTIADVETIALKRESVAVAPEACDRINRARHVVEEIIRQQKVVYGVNTGFGKLSDVTIPADKLRELQINLLRSHAGGFGVPLDEAETRAMMLLRANVLAKG